MFVGLRNVLLLSVCLMFAAGQAGAVALGKIEVTSHLGETFFAEAPLQLDTGEKISDITVEMAASSDYQILEVFRDPALNNLSVEIVHDLRGPRAVISSSQALDTPYFNLVLKLRHGHATNFKKYPVFLDLPEQVRPAATVQAVSVEPIQPEQLEPVQQEPASSVLDARSIEPAAPVSEQAPAPLIDAAADSAIAPTGSEFNPYDGWARTSRYGPMVHGDTVTTVARRLRVDERYTLNQIMVGLFNKNKDKFREGNINLINAGTYLNVPSAAEVESIPASQAEALIKQQEQQWKNLRSQPVYAAEAEAQENRYRTRVNIGQSASGTAAAPMQKDMQAQTDGSTQGNPSMQQADAPAQAAADQMRVLQEENLRLQQALQASEAQVSTAAPATADSAAADERVKKLELTVARLQRQLVLVNQELETAKSQDMNALTYVMGGIILLLIAVAGYLMYLLRRIRPHAPVPEASGTTDAMTVVAAMAAPVAAGRTDEIAGNEAAMNAMDAEAFAASLDNAPDQQHDTDQSNDSMLFDQKAPTAQAGVDYLAEAEVYLRYGMDEEALQQMHLAIEQKPDNLQAHRKLVDFLQSSGDKLAAAAAIEAARSALSGSDLESFENTLPGEQSVDTEIATQTADDELNSDLDVNFDDILAMAEASVTERKAEEPSDEASVAGMALDLGDMGSDSRSATADGLDNDIGLAFDGLPGYSISDEARAQTTTAGLAQFDTEQGAEGALDFVSSIEISEPDEPEVEAGSADVESDHGLDFSLDDKARDDTELSNVLQDLSAGDTQHDDNGLAFEAPIADHDEDESGIAAGEMISLDDDEMDLDAILGEFGKDSAADDGEDHDFSPAGSGESFLRQGADEAVPEAGEEEGGLSANEISALDDAELDLDAILGEFGDSAADDVEDLDFAPAGSGVSPYEQDAEDETVAETGDQESSIAASGISTLDDAELDQDATLGEFAKDSAADDVEDLDFASAGSGVSPYEQHAEDETLAEAGEQESGIAASGISSPDDDEMGLDAILGEFGKDRAGDDEESVDFASAGNGVTTYEQDAEDEAVPETVIDSGLDDDIGIDAILGEFAMHESEGSDEDSDIADASIPETVIEADASDDDELGLDEILGQFESYASDEDEDATGKDSDSGASISNAITDMPEMDVSDELDDLLAEWGEESDGLDFEAGPESLDLDRARSLLAENQLDDAEAALTSALAGDRRGDALIGLAEVAARRGDSARSSELLGEAEDMLDDSNRDWFDSVRNLSA